MKKQNLLLMLMGCVFAVTSLCSCLGDGNDDEQSKVLYLTHAQRMQILNATTGNYTGWMYYADATSHKRDSVAVTWTISGSDSTLTVERSEEHTSELQSRQYLVCRLLLEKKKNI